MYSSTVIVSPKDEEEVLNQSRTGHVFLFDDDLFAKGVFNHRQHLLKLLDEVTRVPLKPLQRTEITRNYTIPKMTYSLVLGQVQRNTPKRLDSYIRKSNNGWLRLPKDTLIGYIDDGKQHGVLGIPSLSATIPMLREARIGRIPNINAEYYAMWSTITHLARLFGISDFRSESAVHK
ncbi:hypothetical protein T265_11732 [Opisthorchis viverrini]|uniref:Uncharacterized protein n=1 Tax=Opisthorchis viverrini TaxID=6198 RepID=A0A074ZWD2_OPIVI|nr:hypothetical protein T265_11732 [Opisthorchis viverrini]KER19514.1 hypothetical protein T265_11732 [Opisthorchis viverrini]